MNLELVSSVLQVVLLSVSVVTVVVACVAVFNLSLLVKSMVPPRVKNYRVPPPEEEEEEPL